MSFKITSEFTPKGDQPQAIEQILTNFKTQKHVTLMGATGTGKTFTVAHVINKLQKNTLVIAHNKTLAYQLFQEFKALFPSNRVEYFISNFDFYQPEAYIASTDTYINKVAHINQQIKMARLSTLNSLVSRNDVIVVASVAAIYGEFNPVDYQKLFFEINLDTRISITQLSRKLIQSGYIRSRNEIVAKSFIIKGDTVTITPGWTQNYYLRVSFFGNDITEISTVDALNRNVIKTFSRYTIFPANDYMMTQERVEESARRIEIELEEQLATFEQQNKIVEKQRLEQITRHDIEEILEFHTCSGVENYSRHLELRPALSAPYTLLDYFGKDWLLVVDESHITIPQIKGMYFADRSRKEELVKYGYRLKSALDNRPLFFKEFENKISQALYISATPKPYELDLVKQQYVEQIIRPTNLIDPQIYVYPKKNQMFQVLSLIRECAKNNERCFITVLTIKMAEELSNYLAEHNVKVTYLHSKIKTLERSQVIFDLRQGLYDCVVGVNLLREGLDVPEVALVIILDADMSGFLRDSTSLIQTIGRASRNINSRVAMFADDNSTAMITAIKETNRRRNLQLEYNKKNNLKPQQVKKPLVQVLADEEITKLLHRHLKKRQVVELKDRIKILANLEEQMLKASKELNFEKAAEIRDLIFTVKKRKTLLSKPKS